MNRALRTIAVAVLMSSACTTGPIEPGVLSLPGSDKSLEQFGTDDSECRLYAASRIQMSGPTAESQGLQRRYDFAYLQCMYSKGNKVPVPGEFRSAPAGNPPPSSAPPPPGQVNP